MNEKEQRIQKAREDDEPVFMRVLASPVNREKHSYIIHAPPEFDKKAHFDVWSMVSVGSLLRLRCYDCKSVKPQHYDSGNFSIGKDDCDFLMMIEDDDLYYFAFRLAEDSRLTDKFLTVRAKDVLKNCEMKSKIDNKGRQYYLISIDEIKLKCKFDVIEPDVT